MKNTFSSKSAQKTLDVSKKCFLSLLFIVFTICSSAGVASANFDLSFGSGGKVLSSPDGSEVTFGQDYALQPDGKIVAVGGGSTFGFLVVRYNRNGSLDTTFGTNGYSSVTFPDMSGSANSVDIQADGKIVVAGTIGRFVNNQQDNNFAVARFNPDGSLDTTFDGDGKTTVSFIPEVLNNGFARELVSDVKVTSDGKIVVGGTVIDTPVFSRLVFAKFNSDGSLDTSFDGDGKLLAENSYVYFNDMTALADGSFVVVCSSLNGNFRIAHKYNVSGTRVWEYSQSSINFNTDGLYGVAVQPDGKLIVAGKRGSRLAAIRLYAENGAEDTTFAAPFLPFGSLWSVAVQPDGKIVATYTLSSAQSPRANSFNVIRYNANGSVDSSFGTNGMFAAAVSGGTDYANRIIAQPDGRILLGGYSTLANPTRYYFSMMRLTGSAASTTRRAAFDYDGDGKSDISVFRPSDGVWYLNNSMNGFTAAAFGLVDDRPVPADYDGDGKTDIAVFRQGNWYILRSFDNSFAGVSFGVASDIAVPADYDGDGRADIAVFRDGIWYLLRSTTGFTAVSFGLAGDRPLPADYDGDGKADTAVFRSSNGGWYRLHSSNGSFNGVNNIGNESYTYMPADFDGDGKADLVTYNPASRQWFRINSSNNSISTEFFGAAGDLPTPADFDGDGKTDLAVFRPSTGTWHLNRSTAGLTAVQWGLASDFPTQRAYLR